MTAVGCVGLINDCSLLLKYSSAKSINSPNICMIVFDIVNSTLGVLVFLDTEIV